MDHFSRLDRSDRNEPFHLTISTHSQSQDLAVRYLPCTKWRKILITALLWIVNSRSIGVTRTSMYSYHRSVAASLAKRMVWLLTALKDDLFPERICNVMFFSSFDSNVVFEVTWKISGKGLLKITRCTVEAAHAISLISPSKSPSSFNTSNNDPTSFVLNERETRFASGMERDRSDLSRSIRHQEIFEPQPGNFGSMDCALKV